VGPDRLSASLSNRLRLWAIRTPSESERLTAVRRGERWRRISERATGASRWPGTENRACSMAGGCGSSGRPGANLPPSNGGSPDFAVTRGPRATTTAARAGPLTAPRTGAAIGTSSAAQRPTCTRPRRRHTVLDPACGAFRRSPDLGCPPSPTARRKSMTHTCIPWIACAPRRLVGVHRPGSRPHSCCCRWPLDSRPGSRSHPCCRVGALRLSDDCAPGFGWAGQGRFIEV